MPFESLQTLLAYQPPPVTQYIGSDILLEETKMCLFGPPKAFKSLAAQQLGFCIAAGIPWLGFKTTQSKVCYLQAEVSIPMFRDRVYKMAHNVGTPNGAYVFQTDRGFRLDAPSHVKKLRIDLEKERPKVLILDPWYKMLSLQDNQSYDRTQDVMDSLIDEFKLSIVMIHHDTVPALDVGTGKTVSFFHPRGPRTVEGWFDSIVMIEGDILTDERKLIFELRHGQELLKPVKLVLDRSKLWIERTK